MWMGAGRWGAAGALAVLALAVVTVSASAQIPRICGDPFRPRAAASGQLAAAAATSGQLAAAAVTFGPVGLISRDLGGSSANGPSGGGAPSADGRHVAFHSEASNLVAGDVNGTRDIFIRDRRTGRTELVSVSSTGAQANGRSTNPWLSGDGRFVVFLSTASSLVAGDGNGKIDAFVRDRALGSTTRVSVGDAGQEANANTHSALISGDGSVVVFSTVASNLAPRDTNGVLDLFVYELGSGIATRLAVSNLSRQSNGESHPGSLSANGNLLAFRSHASNLVRGDTNGDADAFVYNRARGRTERINLGGVARQANNTSFRPMLTSNGRLVVFRSPATNLVRGDTNGHVDVFVRDRVAKTTRRVNRTRTGGQANGRSGRPSISGNGRYVVYASLATNLVPDDRNKDWDVFLRDRRRGRTTKVSTAPGGRDVNACSKVPRLSANGRLVVFKSLASNLVHGDRNRVDDVFVRINARP